MVGRKEVPRGRKMLYSGTEPESCNTEYTSVYEDKKVSGSGVGFCLGPREKVALRLGAEEGVCMSVGGVRGGRFFLITLKPRVE